MRNLPINQIQSLMLDTIVEYRSVQELFDSLYDLIKLPSICFDPTFSPIAYSFPRPFYFPHWEWMIKQGAATTETIREYNYFTYQEKMIHYGSASIFNYDTSYGFPQACGAVMKDGQLVAYCGIMIEDAFPDQVIEATNMLIKTIAIILGRGEQTDKVNPAIVLDKRLSQSQIDFLSTNYGRNFTFFVFSCNETHISILQYVKGYLEAKGHRVIGILSDDGLLYLLYCGVDTQTSCNYLADFIDLSHKYNLVIGQSDTFQISEDISIYREQALLALSTGKRSGRGANVYSFVDVYCNIIYYAAIEYLGQAACTLPEVLLLADEDISHGTEYLKTLDIWLRCSRRKSITGEYLGQHKATVSNRLKKIGVLIGKDPYLCPEDLQVGIDTYKLLYASDSGAEGGL